MQQVSVAAVQAQLQALGYDGVGPAVIEAYLQSHGRLAGAPQLLPGWSAPSASQRAL